MALTIVKHSENNGIKMSVDALAVHAVKNPKMLVMALNSAAGQEWPQILRHSDQEYHFKEVRNVPVMAKGTISGYALYEIQN